MGMPVHKPHPPVEDLTGRWVIEAAHSGDVEHVSGHTGEYALRLWAITVRHADTGALDHVEIRCRLSTDLTVGQSLYGRIERTWRGPVFRRDNRAVGERDD